MVGSTATKPPPFFIVCTIALAGITTIYILTKPRKNKVNRDKLPPAVPYSGFEIIQKLTNGKNHRFTTEMRTLLGPIFSIHLLGVTVPLIVVTDPVLIRKITDGDESLAMPAADKSQRYKMLNALTFGTPNLLTKRTHGEGWDWARKGISPSFSLSNLVKRLPALQQKLKIFTEMLESHYVVSKEVQLEDISSWMLNVTVDFLSASMFGIDFDTLGSRLQKGENGRDSKKQTLGSDFLENISLAMKEFGYKRVINPFRRFMFWSEDARRATKALKRLEEIAVDVVENYRSTHSLEETECDTSILAQLVRSPYPTEKERLADVIILMLAGHDTTAYQLSWLIIELSKHPQVVAKIREELDRVLPAGISPMDSACTSQHLSQMTYLNDVIKEGMRLWPVAQVGSSREAPIDIPYGDYIIPKGASLSLNFFVAFRTGIHDPEAFIPERWTADNPDAKKLRDMVIPFSSGRRNCVGQNLALLELKLVVATLFFQFDFKLVSEVEEDYFITLKPKNANFEVTRRVVA